MMHHIIICLESYLKAIRPSPPKLGDDTAIRNAQREIDSFDGESDTDAYKNAISHGIIQAAVSGLHDPRAIVSHHSGCVTITGNNVRVVWWDLDVGRSWSAYVKYDEHILMSICDSGVSDKISFEVTIDHPNDRIMGIVSQGECTNDGSWKGLNVRDIRDLISCVTDDIELQHGDRSAASVVTMPPQQVIETR